MPFITDVAGPAWGVAGMSGNELFQCLNILNIHAISSPVFFSLIPQTLQWPPNRAICSLQGFPLLKRRVRCHTVPTSDCICKHMIVPYEKILGTSWTNKCLLRSLKQVPGRSVQKQIEYVANASRTVSTVITKVPKLSSFQPRLLWMRCVARNCEPYICVNVCQAQGSNGKAVDHLVAGWEDSASWPWKRKRDGRMNETLNHGLILTFFFSCGASQHQHDSALLSAFCQQT